MKKIGIITDNYKLEKFKQELIIKGFSNFEIFPYKGILNSSVVNIKTDRSKLVEIENICKEVELHFK